jgi:hypothetical protein
MRVNGPHTKAQPHQAGAIVLVDVIMIINIIVLG